jgi:hypothetical protein
MERTTSVHNSGPTHKSSLDQTAIFNASLSRNSGPDVTGTVDQLDQIAVDAVSSLKELAAPWFSDQILPFDITLAGTNEVGAATCMRIYGVEILNEGSGVSIDDAVTEMQATFVARYVDPWHAVTDQGVDGINPGIASRPPLLLLRARAHPSRQLLSAPPVSPKTIIALLVFDVGDSGKYLRRVRASSVSPERTSMRQMTVADFPSSPL